MVATHTLYIERQHYFNKSCVHHTSTTIISHGSRGRLAYRTHVGSRTFYSEHARNILEDRLSKRSYNDGMTGSLLRDLQRKLNIFFQGKLLNVLLYDEGGLRVVVIIALT